jgi:ATP-dependent DNA helicase RecG
MAEAGRINLTTPLRGVAGIGPKTAAGLATLGLTNVGRLIAHLPLRHERLEAESTVAEIAPEQLISARGEITATRIVPRGRRPRFEAVLLDETGRLDLVWFNGMYLQARIKPGHRLRVQGKARRFGPGIQVANPSFEILSDDAEPDPREARVRPVYPANDQINSKQIEKAVGRVLADALPLIEDHLSPTFRAARDMPELAPAYRAMHAPESEADATAARRRLAYDELLLLQLGVHMKRAHLRLTLRAPALRHSPAIDRHIRARFPFALTEAQDRVIAEIARDLSSPTPTNRLIQGDVGSGKTVVALYAMLMAVATESATPTPSSPGTSTPAGEVGMPRAGHQAALMAPTELLAEQHYASISRMLEGSRVRVELLTGSTPRAERESILSRLRAGEVDILIGTHALLTEGVTFRSLAVVIVDEQHRFGVHHRAMLRTKGSGGQAVTPHMLVMTATPIPRTLAITLFGDLDISTIDELPPGRTPVDTAIARPADRPAVYRDLRAALDRGEQAFIVVPAIEESDGEIESVRALLRRLEEGELAGKRLAAIHGRLKPATRDHVMERFRTGLIDALIATTVIEVGVDVPNATVMVIEGADRFGLAQLHQLRGRVGRGRAASRCILVADPITPDAVARLDAIAATTDGFALAEKDMELRGPGELFGTRQSGIAPFKVADLARDLPLLQMARRDAADWIARSPALSAPNEATLLRRLLKAHGESLGLGDVG